MHKVSSFFVVENIAPGTWNTLFTQNFRLKNRFHKPFCQARHLGPCLSNFFVFVLSGPGRPGPGMIFVKPLFNNMNERSHDPGMISKALYTVLNASNSKMLQTSSKMGVVITSARQAHRRWDLLLPSLLALLTRNTWDQLLDIVLLSACRIVQP